MNIITNIPESVLQLDEHFELKPPPVADSGMPDIEGLKPQQKAAFDELVSYINGESQDRAKLLKGYAGTGKTHTVVQLIKYLITIKHCRIAITAPTNKAVKVLRDTSNFKHNLLMFKTIHSLLGLKENIDENGKQTFIKEFGSESEIDDIDVLIVDETSMLPDELFDMVNPYVEQGLKLIFMGDPIQIPPVNKLDCIPFIYKHQVTHKIGVIELTEVVRQKEGNPILELATTIRNDVQADVIDFNYQTTVNDKGGIIMINTEDKELLFKLCDIYFSNGRFQADSDFIKVIAWTNKTVDFMNNKIRRMLYKNVINEKAMSLLRQENGLFAPDENTEEYKTQLKTVADKISLPRLMIGEKLIADKPIVVEDPFDKRRVKVLFTTNDEFVVDSFSEEVVDVFGNYVVKVYRTKVTGINPDGKPVTKEIDIVHEEGEKTMQEVLIHMKKLATGEKDPNERKKRWRYYFSVANKFAQVKYNYAITAHKSQGSTYDHVIVIDADIEKNPKVIERNRIKYVAYTRARTNLIIVKS